MNGRSSLPTLYLHCSPGYRGADDIRRHARGLRQCAGMSPEPTRAKLFINGLFAGDLSVPGEDLLGGDSVSRRPLAA